MRRHTDSEKSQILTKAAQLASDGKLQADAARELGVSVMTLHRWRNEQVAEGSIVLPIVPNEDEFASLARENRQLRELVVNVLLELDGARRKFSMILDLDAVG